MKRLLILSIISAALMALPQSANAQMQWTVVTPAPTTNTLSSLTYGNGLYVALGFRDIYSSPDGVVWTSRDPGTSFPLYSLTYGNSQFLIVAPSTADSVVTVCLPACYGQPSCPCGIQQYLMRQKYYSVTSTDGMTWNYNLLYTCYSTTRCGPQVRDVTFGHGSYVAISSDSAVGLVSSFGGWQQVTKTAISMTSISYANDRFIAMGGTGANGRVVSCQQDSVSIASAWTIHTLPTTAYLSSATYGNGEYVIVGYTGTILTSPDFINWTSQMSGTLSELLSVAYGNNLFVAVGDSGTILNSTDGINWSPDSSGTANPLFSVTTNGTGQFVAVGSNGTIVVNSGGVTAIKSAPNISANNFILKAYSRNFLLSIFLPSSMLGRAVDLAVYSASGRVVMQKKVAAGTERLSIPVPNLAVGAYVLSVKDGIQKKAVRFVVTR